MHLDLWELTGELVFVYLETDSICFTLKGKLAYDYSFRCYTLKDAAGSELCRFATKHVDVVRERLRHIRLKM